MAGETDAAVAAEEVTDMWNIPAVPTWVSDVLSLPLNPAWPDWIEVPMHVLLVVVVLCLLAIMALAPIAVPVLAVIQWVRGRSDVGRAAFIRDYPFPEHLREAVRNRWPHLNEWQLERIEQGLRSFFMVRLQVGAGDAIVVPSRAVEVLWQAFVWDAEAYEAFCRAAYGDHFRPIPHERMRMRSRGACRDALEKAWRGFCQADAVDPRNPPRLPWVFQLDAQFRIEDGHRFEWHPPTRMVRVCDAESGRSDAEAWSLACGETWVSHD